MTLPEERNDAVRAFNRCGLYLGERLSSLLPVCVCVRVRVCCLTVGDSGHAWSGAVQQQVRRTAGSGQVWHGGQDGAHLVQEEHGTAHPGLGACVCLCAYKKLLRI